MKPLLAVLLVLAALFTAASTCDSSAPVSNAHPQQAAPSLPALIPVDQAQAICFTGEIWSGPDDVSQFLGSSMYMLGGDKFALLATWASANMECSAVDGFSYWWAKYLAVSAARHHPTIDEASAWSAFQPNWKN